MKGLLVATCDSREASDRLVLRLAAAGLPAEQLTVIGAPPLDDGAQAREEFGPWHFLGGAVAGGWLGLVVSVVPRFPDPLVTWADQLPEHSLLGSLVGLACTAAARRLAAGAAVRRGGTAANRYQILCSESSVEQVRRYLETAATDASRSTADRHSESSAQRDHRQRAFSAWDESNPTVRTCG